ncbi:hypothetical protein M407DRAFT_33541 [Tulasnella calospora MUT 4182]|uniref:Uncharacterized protein n=1 Tax=Tulasnella calospora MUT 4182 TaxID=1051891 RepID=A0A0C3PQH5_9AGAM|nr:hypothetical protein M407DRAFT_33541 [Tulasnella calospora MUT 4182]
MASYETIQVTGKSVVCLSLYESQVLFSEKPVSKWFHRGRLVEDTDRSLDKGGIAVILAPAIAPGVDMLPGGSEVAGSVTAQLVGSASKDAINKAVDWLLVDKPLDDLPRNHAHNLNGNSAKETLVSLRYKHVTKGAALGFFRSPEHEDSSILSKGADYFAIENGVVLTSLPAVDGNVFVSRRALQKL